VKTVMYHSTNNKEEHVDFETALMNGLASNYGLYMISRKEIPKLLPKP
jgi:threonine synthase